MSNRSWALFLCLGLLSTPVFAGLRPPSIEQTSRITTSDLLGQQLLAAMHQARVSFYNRTESTPLVEFITTQYSAEHLELLMTVGNPEVRRAAAYGLTLIGRPESQSVLAVAIRDPDEQVRRWAEQASWKIWVRAGTEDEQAQLKVITELLARGELDTALRQSSLLVERSPHYAEAWNQRALAYYHLQRYSESIRDCRKVLSLNRHHFGASVGMARCLLKSNQLREAYEALHLTQEIHPHLVGLSDQILYVKNELQKHKLAVEVTPDPAAVPAVPGATADKSAEPATRPR